MNTESTLWLGHENYWGVLMAKEFSVRSMPLGLLLCLGAMVVNAGGFVASAMWDARTEYIVPVKELVENVRAYAKENPKSAHAYFALGRLYSLAHAKGSQLKVTPGRGPNKNPGLPQFDAPPYDEGSLGNPRNDESFDEALSAYSGGTQRARKQDAKKIGQREQDHVTELDGDIKNLQESVRNYLQALELAPKESRIHLGLGWVLEELAVISERLDTKDVAAFLIKEAPTAEEVKRFNQLIAELGKEAFIEREAAQRALGDGGLKAIEPLFKALHSDDAEVRSRVAGLLQRAWRIQAVEKYREALRLAPDKDVAEMQEAVEAGEDKPTDFEKDYFQDNSFQHATAYEAAAGLARMLSRLPEIPAEKAKQEINAAKKKAMNFGMSITPIIFPMDDAKELSNLEDASVVVEFDLDGLGPRKWPWLRPNAGLLVWDPLRTGKINSGRQLFGSITWWIFWENGYQALDALDRNRDGQLTGDELAGIRIWCDRNQNAVSDDGEMRDLDDAGIASIAVRPQGRHAGVPWSPMGITYASGATAPTFDWTPRARSKPEGLPMELEYTR
jgi:hypothetical protein